MPIRSSPFHLWLPDPTPWLLLPPLLRSRPPLRPSRSTGSGGDSIPAPVTHRATAETQPRRHWSLRERNHAACGRKRRGSVCCRLPGRVSRLRLREGRGKVRVVGWKREKGGEDKKGTRAGGCGGERKGYILRWGRLVVLREESRYGEEWNRGKGWICTAHTRSMGRGGLSGVEDHCLSKRKTYRCW